MKTTTESQLRKVALGLTAVVLLLLVWSGVRLLLISEPESTVPAEGSLQVDEIRAGAPLNEELSQSLKVRPVFWQGRQAFVPVVGGQEVSEPESVPRNSNIDDVELQGVYSAGGKSGVIIAYKDERRRLRLDEEIAGWTFTLLTDDGATFESGSETRVLELVHATPAPAPKQKREPSPDVDEAVKQDEANKPDETGE